MSSYSHTSSSASLVSHQQPRDYSAAFSALASSYGSSGAAPCRPSSKTASHQASEPVSSPKRLRSLFSRRSSSSAASPPAACDSEKYVVPKSQDFGALMDKYGASMSVGSGRGVL